MLKQHLLQIAFYHFLLIIFVPGKNNTQLFYKLGLG